MFRHILLVFSIVMLAACASAPTQEMSDARQAVQAAQEAGAGQNAPDSLQDAQQRLDRAGTELQTGEFRKARKDAVAAKSNAIDAQDMAHAIGAARAAVEQAAAHGILSEQSQSLLERAEQAARYNDVLTAIRLANEAKHHAQQDLRLEEE